MSFLVGFRCDRCGEKVMYEPEHALNKGDMMRFARSEGWTVGKSWKCPNCKTEKKAK